MTAGVDKQHKTSAQKLSTVSQMSMPQIITDGQTMAAWRASLSTAQPSAQSAQLDESSRASMIGFVPTMGALHEGHLTLIRQAREQCQHVVVSIFVNPLQFGPTEDFGKYPRTFERDLELCQEAGVDVVFYPTVQVIYPGGQEVTTKVIPPETLEKTLYGQYRPAFFAGVATVVTRLFNLVQPNVAYFGEKDFQQLVVIKKMVFDLHIPVRIEGVQTVRQKDGLACSSRNVFLSDQQKKDAPLLFQTLQSIARSSTQGANLTARLAEGRAIISRLLDVDLKYLVACDVDTLEELSEAKFPMVLLVAAKFKEVWLIDALVVPDHADSHQRVL